MTTLSIKVVISLATMRTQKNELLQQSSETLESLIGPMNRTKHTSSVTFITAQTYLQ